MSILRIVLVCVAIHLTAGLAAAGPPTEQEILAGADARIEELRKANATIIVVSRTGEPVPDAQVHIELIRHAFPFGSGAGPLPDTAKPGPEDAYQRQFIGLFNQASLDFSWDTYEAWPDKTSADRLTRQARWCRSHGVTPIGTALFRRADLPKWAPTGLGDMQRRVRNRIKDTTSKFAGLIDQWELTADIGIPLGADNAVEAWLKADGTASVLAELMQWAYVGNPKATLVYEDSKLDEEYTKLVEALFARNVPIGGLGLKTELRVEGSTPALVWASCETLNRLGKPLHFTVIGVPSSALEDEAKQADCIEKVYTALFSHPAVQSISWTNLVDGKVSNGLLRADLTQKPAYQRLLSLIYSKWKTAADLTTNEEGTAGFRGFAGRYRITVTAPLITSIVETEVIRGHGNEFKIRLD